MLTYTFVIPVKPGGSTRALQALREIIHPKDRYEIIIVEGTSPSCQRNTAASQAKGDIVYFLDDDSLVAAHCLSLCDSVFSNPDVAVAGGPSLTPSTDSPLQRLFGLALTSPFGAGAVRNRYRAVGAVRDTTERELILCNLAVRRDVFLSLGGFDERLYPNEENEFLDRVQNNRHRILHVPELSVLRSQRRSVRSFARQMFSYGRGRAEQTLISHRLPVASLVPAAFLVYLLLLPLVAGFHTWLWAPLCAYLLFSVLFAGISAATSGKLSALGLAGVFPLMHIANASGLLYGFIPRPRSHHASPSPVVVRKVKAFEQSTF